MILLDTRKSIQKQEPPVKRQLNKTDLAAPPVDSSPALTSRRTSLARLSVLGHNASKLERITALVHRVISNPLVPISAFLRTASP